NGELPALADYCERFPSLELPIAALLVELLAKKAQPLAPPPAVDMVADPQRTTPYVPDVPLAIPVFSSLPATNSPSVPGYEIIEELGRGAMGIVYKARHVALNRTVALKMILAGDGAGAEELKRFMREAETVARLQHPNIVQIYDIGEYHGMPFFSLELCA